MRVASLERTAEQKVNSRKRCPKSIVQGALYTIILEWTRLLGLYGALCLDPRERGTDQDL